MPCLPECVPRILYIFVNIVVILIYGMSPVMQIYCILREHLKIF